MLFKRFCAANPHALFIYSLIIADVFRLFWMIYFQPEIASDARWYFEKAYQMSDGQGYHDEGEKTAFYPVGYPAFLSLVFSIFGSNVFTTRILNLFLYLGFMFVFYKILLQIKVPVKAAGWSCILLAVYPNHIAYVNLLYSENLFIFIFFLSIYFYFFSDKNRFFILISGFCFGLSVLIRPAALFIPLLLILLPGFKSAISEKIKKIVFIYVILAITVLPWTIRNYSVFGKFVWVSTTAGYDLLIGNNHEAKGNYHLNEALFKSIPEHLTETEYDAYTKKLAIKYLAEYPNEAISRLPSKIFYFLWPPSEGIGWNLRGIDETKMQVLKNISFYNNIFLLIIAAFLVLFAVIFKLNPVLIRLLLITGGYYLFVSMVFFGESRFHFHLIPIVFSLVANGFTLIREK